MANFSKFVSKLHNLTIPYYYYLKKKNALMESSILVQLPVGYTCRPQDASPIIKESTYFPLTRVLELNHDFRKIWFHQTIIKILIPHHPLTSLKTNVAPWLQEVDSLL